MMTTDPVCGMTVADDSQHYVDLNGVRYLFCSAVCKQKFEQHPEQYLHKHVETSASGCCSNKTIGKATSEKSSVNDDGTQLTSTASGCGCSSKEEPKAVSNCCGHDSKPLDQKNELIQATTMSSCCGTKSVETVASTEKTQPQAKSCCGGGQHQHTDHESSQTEIDPVCGMKVSSSSPLHTDYQGKEYYFCNPSCLEKFKKDPETYLVPLDQRAIPEGAMDIDYTCPMDPEIVQKGPGTCPICGMALEPMQPTLDEGPNPELVDFKKRFWTTLPLTLLVVVLAMGSHIHAFISPHIQPWIELVLSIPVVLWAGYPFLQRCWISYKTRHLNMWSLIGVGILAAFIYSVIATIFPSIIPVQAKTGHGVAVYFEAACMIVSLSLLGQIMELKARAQTADSLRALLRLQPHTAKRVGENGIEEVDIGLIHKGEILQISSGEQIPLDGVVIEGQTYVDESMMTGEAVPVKKQKDDHVIGGTVNQQGSVRIETTAVGTQTTLAKMIQAVAEAQRSKAPLQRIADVAAKYFVMAVLSISLITFVVWMLFGHAQFDLALMCAVAVLIIACPCALGLATPMSVMATTGRAAQKGVLFKDAEAIEALSKVNVLIIDKTGTLTEGKPSLQQIKVLDQTQDQKTVERYIASIEQYSTHPIAQTLTKLVGAEQLLKVDDFEDVTGFGVKGQIEGKTYYVGSQKLVDQLGLNLDPAENAELDQRREQGDVISFLMNEQTVLAYIVIHDAIKDNAKVVIDQLHQDGIEVIMATGDHDKNAQMVAQQLGIEHAYGNLDPEQKLEIVKRYQSQAKVVAMAGDGINDAPALAQANVGIAMGTGTDIAKQTAQITLVKGDIQGVAQAVHMAKQGVKNMKQNLAFSFLYNGLGVPVAAGIFYPLTGWLLTPMVAAIAMSLSSLSVVLNALRLRKL
ncbi:heavy metal translocating P-type ATPase [Acinetobacter ihumii]|uniref:heavy metal translocating P-type ATPase n=1 Tax=Acinetobacter ihumii TaxID=2483802 RepID=UPI003D72B65E